MAQTEKLLAALWCEFLGVDAVGLHDNFFDLGGHSLLAIRMVGRIKDETGCELRPNTALFNTLERMAGQLEDCVPAGEEQVGSDEAPGLAGKIRSLFSGSDRQA